MGKAATLVNGRQPFLQSFIFLSQEGSKWNLSNIGPEAPVGKSFEILNIFFPYKCIRKQTWPYRKKVKCQCTTIIWATLVDLLFPMIYAKIQPQGIHGFGEEDFKCFFPYKCIGKQTWHCRKKSNVNVRPLF